MGMLTLPLFKRFWSRSHKNLVKENLPTEMRKIINDEKDEDVPEEVTSVKINFTIKELSVIFHDTESTKDKMLEGDPNLESSRAICHDLEDIHSIPLVT